MAAALVVVVLLALAGLAFTPFGKNLLGLSQKASSDSTEPVATPPPVIEERRGEQEIKDAFREARLAQEAAEKLSQMLHNAEVNRQLLELVEARPQPDVEAIQNYRLAAQAIERGILDAETAYLLAAKRLNGHSPETVQKAFDRLDEDVGRAGVGWRNRVAEMLRRSVPAVTPETLRVDPALRDELKKLQSAP